MKLSSQKSLSDEFHEIIQKLTLSNTLERRNLSVAIVMSKRPGYFEYYESNDEIKHLESGDILKKLATQISDINREIDQINQEIRHYEQDMNHKNCQSQVMDLSQVSQWFDVYGRPTRSDSRLTTFVPNKKVYGGNSHYASFRSVSVTMKKGRITN